tara:strand:- start:2757 stop:3350 length:594 start_codon:yes stop_codon:yes gene_type:complete
MKATLLILSLMLLQSCSKSDDTFTPTLPPITQTGANTFGVYIDGKLLTPRDGTGTFNSPDRGMRLWGFSNSSDAELSVHDFKSGTGGLIDIHIVALHQNGQGIFTINESNCEDGVDANDNINIRCRWWDETTQSYKWYCSIDNGGTLNISRYDAENFIVSGTFNCTVQNRDNPNDIIEITQGRFDINRYTLEETDFP